ncbi:MAG: amino acid ABC transporter permease, partial [Alphaproteobacteria bacterium]
SNTLANLAERQIRTGFAFLDHDAGFFIGEGVISFDAADSYGRAFIVGLLNTLQVALIGIALATALGAAIGIARLSKNWLVARLASIYVEGVRNVPLLLQLFLWYSIVTGALPESREAFNPLPGVYLSKSGLKLPVPVSDPAYLWAGVAFAAGVVASLLFRRWARARQAATGAQIPVLWSSVALIVGLPILAWTAGGAPTAMDVPVWQKFRFVGGSEFTPEFLALLFGLTTYTAGFIAEIVRAGILAVERGQTEAALAVGLRRGLVLRLVILPQALRVIVPPLTSQYLNLTKNSSLAVAIGYPELVSIANTTLNQTGQAIECIAIIMAVYLTVSLTISMSMNWYNKRIALVER